MQSVAAGPLVLSPRRWLWFGSSLLAQIQSHQQNKDEELNTMNLLKVNDIHQKHDDLNDGENDHSQRRRTDGHLFLVRTIRLVALQRPRRRHHIPTIPGEHIAYHKLVAQRHAIELLKVQMSIVIHITAVQYLLGNVGGYIVAAASRN